MPEADADNAVLLDEDSLVSALNRRGLAAGGTYLVDVPAGVEAVG